MDEPSILSGRGTVPGPPLSRRFGRSHCRAICALFALAMAGAGLACAPVRSRAEIQDQVDKKLGLAKVLVEGSNYSQAIAILTDLARQQPKNAEVHLFLGIADYGLGDYPAAETALREAIRLDPRGSDGHYYYGVVCFAIGGRERDAGRAAEAQARFKQALEEWRRVLGDPTFSGREQVYLSLSEVDDALGDGEEAMRMARQAIELQPTFYPAHFRVAVLLDRLDRLREAIEEYEIAAPGYSSDPAYHFRLGVAYFRDRKPDLAREHLTKVTAAVPGTENAKKAKEFLELIAAPSGAPPGSTGAAPR